MYAHSKHRKAHHYYTDRHAYFTPHPPMNPNPVYQTHCWYGRPNYMYQVWLTKPKTRVCIVLAFFVFLSNNKQCNTLGIGQTRLLFLPSCSDQQFISPVCLFKEFMKASATSKYLGNNVLSQKGMVILAQEF